MTDLRSQPAYRWPALGRVGGEPCSSDTVTVDLIACILASLRAGESQHARAGGEQARVGLSESLPGLEKTSESVGWTEEWGLRRSQQLGEQASLATKAGGRASDYAATQSAVHDR